MPIFLWSTVVSHSTTTLRRATAAWGRPTARGWGATQKGLILLRRDRVHLERHRVVVEAAELVALPEILTRLAGLDPAVVHLPGDGIDLAPQPRHPEGMQHVAARHLDPDDLANRDHHLGEAALTVRVFEAPGPLDAGHLDRHLGRRAVANVVHPERGSDEQEGDDHHRDRRPQELKPGVAVHLRRLAVVFAPETERGIDDQAADHHQHRQGDPEDSGVEIDDAASLWDGGADGADVDRFGHQAHDSVLTTAAIIGERATSGRRALSSR